MPATATTATVVTDGGSSDVRLTVWVRGRVQGVGFRWWTRARARQLGLVGSATNLEDGRVEIVAEGPEDACRALLASLDGRVAVTDPAGHPPRPGRVDGVTQRWSEPHGGFTGFVER